ncbi:MAG TPA: mismatch-specific DNA-glycosylase [Polyangia bacterium]|nr:mismatch-specific DNA-glycosylase [Polyangia bacterium]
MPRLRDVICPRPRLLLVGINPGLRSGAVGHHFAGRGNPFWRLIHAAGLVPTLLSPDEDQRLGEHGIALTNLVARTTRTAAELTRDERARGARLLTAKIRRLRPAVVAFVGLSLYQDFFGYVKSGGPGVKPEQIADAAVFVVPNPSGLNASFPGFDEKLIWYRRLATFVAERSPRPVRVEEPSRHQARRHEG